MTLPTVTAAAWKSTVHTLLRTAYFHCGYAETFLKNVLLQKCTRLEAYASSENNMAR